jgi:hypothetical protein
MFPIVSYSYYLIAATVRAADASPNTPVARTLWGAAVRQELSPNRGIKKSFDRFQGKLPFLVHIARAVNKKAEATPINGALWKSSVHEKVNSERC